MWEIITQYVQVIANTAIILAAFIAIFALKENMSSRKTAIKPLLSPGRIKEFHNDDNLFACNYEYPISEDIGVSALVYFGIKNIGKGPAKNVRVLRFQSEEESPIEFRVGYNSINIPEGESVPFVLRIKRDDLTDYYFVTYYTSLYYEDIFGDSFYLSVRLWVQESGIVVLEYTDNKNPKWKKHNTVISREVESYGYFETRRLEEELKKKSD